MRRRSGAGVVAAVLLGSAGVVGAAPRLIYETNLVAEPPLVRPSSVRIIQGTGEICVTDEGARRIAVFDGRGLHRFSTSGAAGLVAPLDADIDPRGDFVCTDLVRKAVRTIRRFNFLGEPVRYEPQSAGEDWSPVHLTVAPDGHYLTVDGTGLLAKHDSVTGALLWRLSLAEAGWERADQLGRPAIAPDGTIHVPNAGLGRVHVVSQDGESITSYGERGTKPGELSFPVSVAFGPEGSFLVLDRMRHKLLVFDSEYRFVEEFGRVGFDPGAFYHPLAVAATPEGTVFVTQGFEGRIQRFRLEGVVPAERRLDVTRD